jgi:nitrogen fixation/metabolism regulation signal transduction histidine kinase
MQRKTGKEMKQLMVAITLSALVLTLAIIAYFMTDAIVTTNKNIESDKQKMVEQSVSTLNDMAKMASMTNFGPDMFSLFNPEIVQRAVAGDMEFIYQMTANIVSSFYPVDYVGVIKDGEVVAYKSKENAPIDVQGMPTEPPQGNYDTLDKLGDREGFFVSVFVPLDLSLLGQKGTVYINVIADRTDQLATIDNYFTNQRSSMIWRLSIAAIIAIILSVLLTTLGLRYFTEKYVVKPIEKLNQTAEAIMDGSFEGEVEYDEGSSFAALQGLLRSGQRVLRKMDDEIKE